MTVYLKVLFEAPLDPAKLGMLEINDTEYPRNDKILLCAI